MGDFSLRQAFHACPVAQGQWSHMQRVSRRTRVVARRGSPLARFRAGLLACLATLACGSVVAATPASVDTWSIDSGAIDPAGYHGVTVANGMVGIVSSPVPLRTGQAVINGAYEPIRPGSVGSTLATLNPMNLVLAVDGVKIERLDQVRDFRQQLRMKHAALVTAFDYQGKATIRYTIRALRDLPYTVLMEVTVDARQPIRLSSASLISPDPMHPIERPYAFADLRTWSSRVDVHSRPPRTIMVAAASGRTPSGAVSVAAAQSYLFDGTGAAPAVTYRDGGVSFTHDIPAGASYRFALVGTTLTSAHVPDPLNESRRLAAAATIRGIDRLVAGHERAWANLWTSDIRIEGDDGMQRDVRSMLYHLYSFIREDSGYSISPMGLSRTASGYMGHVFWDAEMWMLPALLALRPELARTMLDYRFARLEAARRNAAAHGYRGAKFPWESATTGDEDTWSTAITASLEVHVTADVGLAAWNYYRVTRDERWLREKGWPLIRESAGFWTSYVERNGPGRYDITHVVGADEYAEDVDNDAFTNAAVKANLAAATAAARVLGIPPDPDWEHVRVNIPILRFPDGVTRQHAAYEGEKIKQADAVLLAYPLKEISDRDRIWRDLKYYDARTDHTLGPAMTKSVFAVLYQRLGDPQKALQMFRDGYKPNERPPFGLLAENASSENPYFATGAGGLLQTMLYGFGGLDITDEGLVHEPGSLPSGWKSLTLTGIGPDERTLMVEGAR